MSDKAIAVIAEALREVDRRWNETRNPESAEDNGCAILAALKAARIAVVELPEPAESIHDGDRVAFPNETHCDVRVTATNAIVYDRDWINDPSEARSLAAAFLAAAEAVSS